MDKKYLKFWGTRGTCAVSGPEYMLFGGNTSCLELCYNDIRIVFDAGSGIYPLGNYFVKEKVKKFDLFFGHTHWDHIIGFPFFDPIYEPDVNLTIWGPERQARRRCEELLNEVFAPEFFPLNVSDWKAKVQFKVFDDRTPVKLGPITIAFHKVNHPGGAYCFKIQTPHQTIGYATDNEILEPYEKNELSLIEFYKGCDLLIHEAQYFPEEYVKRQGWGHSCILKAADFIEKTSPREWLVTHHDIAHTDDKLIEMSKLALQQCSVPSTWLKDGQVIGLQ